MSNELELDDFDFGFASIDEDTLKNGYLEEVSQASQDKCQQMYDAILPLLNNLAKDADKNAYIHWPNRKKKLAEFKKRLESILNS